MRSTWSCVLAAGLMGAVACGGAGGQPGGRPDDGGTGGTGGTTADAGGVSDAGSGPDAGNDAGTDAGTPDAGADGGVIVVNPPSLGPDWSFFTAADGLVTQDVRGVSADESGNIWVAGGAAGLFVQRGGQGKFQQFGLADGLHPYGYLNGEVAKFMGVPDGTAADSRPSLAATPVISVAGGRAGTVFVGYQGKDGCEGAWNWDQFSSPSTWGDPAVYKSGDADKVTLGGSGISVVHYDIFSGPGVVSNEQGGRERLCSVLRILYQHGTNLVWFGANHGFAMGKADFANNPTCDGQISCAGVLEHVHPAFNDNAGDLVTDAYSGIAIDPLSQGGLHDVWFGGAARTTRFRFGETGGNYFSAADRTQTYTGDHNVNTVPAALAAYHNRIDVWPDAVGEYDAAGNPTFPTKAQWIAGLDIVSGIAADPADNSVYVASFGHGIRHLDHDGHPLGDLTQANKALFNDNVSAIAIDTDGSLWVGYHFTGGISRIHKGGAVEHFVKVLGALGNSPVLDIQLTPTTPRKVLVAFQNGAVAVYRGN
jgi:two component regulator with propeller domain